jgi:bud site selection protein 31
MPAIRTSKNRKPPPDGPYAPNYKAVKHATNTGAGFEDIEDTLLEFSNKMKDAENASHEGKKKHEMQWPIFQITHQRTYLPV